MHQDRMRPEYQHEVSDLVQREVIYCVSHLVSELAQKYEHFPEYEDDLLNAFDGPIDYEEAALAEDWLQDDDGSFFKIDPYQYYLSINLNERGLLSVSVHHVTAPDQGSNGETVWEFSGTAYEAANLDGSGSLDAMDPCDVLTYLQELTLLDAYDELYMDPACNFETSDAEDWQELCETENIDTDDYRREVFEHWIVSNYLARELEKRGERVLTDFFGLTVWCRTTTGQGIAGDEVICDIYDALHEPIDATNAA